MSKSNRSIIPYPLTLDSMTRWISDFYTKDCNKINIKNRTVTGVYDFCLNNSTQFRDQFLNKTGIPIKYQPKRTTPTQELVKGFVSFLSKENGSCIFLLNDTWDIYQAYLKERPDAFGFLFNRELVCHQGNENDYFKLVKLVYDSLYLSSTLENFLLEYFRLFQEIVKKEQHFLQLSEQVADSWRGFEIDNKTIWVDVGLQFTFVLFCIASVKYHLGSSIPQTFMNFTAFPWLQSRLKNYFYTEKSECIMNLEKTATLHQRSKFKT